MIGLRAVSRFFTWMCVSVCSLEHWCDFISSDEFSVTYSLAFSFLPTSLKHLPFYIPSVAFFNLLHPPYCQLYGTCLVYCPSSIFKNYHACLLTMRLRNNASKTSFLLETNPTSATLSHYLNSQREKTLVALLSQQTKWSIPLQNKSSKPREKEWQLVKTKVLLIRWGGDGWTSCSVIPTVEKGLSLELGKTPPLNYLLLAPTECFQHGLRERHTHAHIYAKRCGDRMSQWKIFF